MFPGPARHTPEQTRLAFDAMLAAAAAHLRPPGPVAPDGARLGAPAVHLRPSGRVALDGCCFARPDQRDRARDLARATGVRHLGVHLALPPAEAARRVASSGPHPANDRDAALVARLAAGFAPPEPDDLLIDATLPPPEVWPILRRALEDAGRPA